MINKLITQGSIDHFKRQAKRLKKETGITQIQALDQIAKREGFKNWPDLMASKPKLKDGDQDWNTPCQVCNAVPTVHPVALCGPCCFGDVNGKTNRR